MTQTSDNPYRNNNLFSNYYLEKYIPESPEWKKKDHIAIFAQIKKIYTREFASIKTLNEKQLENHFFNEIFSILGFVYEVTEPTYARNFPDYAFFFDRNGLDDAHKKKETIPFFTNAIAIGEVKQWKVDLDKVSKNEYNISENPSLQIWTYLEDTEQKWGILSNGRIWRLYCKERRRDNYLEIDLSRLIESNDTDTFRFFYYFFRKDAFVKSKEGQAFLDRVLNESQDYAQKIGDDLKDNVYWAMKRIAEGFTNEKSNHLDSRDPVTLARVQSNTMILLYRFLFLLYAEGKGLLDLHDQRYREYYSFHHIKHFIAETQDGPAHQRFDTVKSSIQADLKVLFKLVDQGSESFGIPKTEYFIPAYNGGLFDPDKHLDLEHWEIGDRYLADAIDLLSRSKLKEGHRDFIDYSTLEIRNLGSIYEGLLEYKLKVAESDLVVSDSGWVSLDAYNASRKQKKGFTDIAENDRVNAGNLYLATDKGDRKTSGSYYTPDYIVNYIVKNTIGPIVEQKLKVALEKDESCIDATLSINILDPAMGSGHFLVGAVEFLSQKLLEAVQKDFETGKVIDTTTYTNDWARRDVVSHCIYGVDLNELAVELAKVGLWLTTISKDKPLSFLDHRLKQGNSLVGARLTNLRYYPGKEPKEISQAELPTSISPRFIGHILSKIAELEVIEENRLEDIKLKEKAFEEFRHLPEYQRAKGLANVYTAMYFGNTVTPTEKKSSEALYQDLVWAIAGDESEWQYKTKPAWFKQACDIAKEKSFFHWELEFPEIFFDAGKLKEDPGWDAVIGNPPYGLFSESQIKGYIQRFYYSSQYQPNKYVLFIELSIRLANKFGYESFIVPPTFLTMNYFSDIRKYILDNVSILTLIHFKYSVFEDPTVDSSIFILRRDLDLISRSNNTIKTTLPDNISEFHHLNNFQNALQSDFAKNPKYEFYIHVGHEDSLILTKLMNKEFPTLGNIGDIVVGIKPYQVGKGVPKQTREMVENRVYDAKFERDNTYHQYLVGTDVRRYSINPDTTRWISYGIWLAEPRSKAPFFEDERIVIRRTGDSIISAIENQKRLTLNSVWNLKILDVNIKASFLVAILNSKLFTYLHQNKVPDKNRVFAEVKDVDLLKQPIPKIIFSTPCDIRTSQINEAKKMYQSFMQSPDPQHILAFVDARLAAQPDESDVIHDFLAYLVEQMVEMNKTKNEEIKTFLNFVETEIGTAVDTLSNKTQIQEYYEYDLTKFIDVLVKNKSKIQAGYNPKSRIHHDTLKDWYDSSVAKLNPLIANIRATDALIDQVVYRLYRLTKEEIQIVKGGLSREYTNR